MHLLKYHIIVELIKENDMVTTDKVTLTEKIGIKDTNLDLVMCKECKKHGKNSCPITFTYAVITDDNNYCTYAEKRADYTVFTVNPPKGVETSLKGDAVVFHKNSKNNSNRI